MGHFIISRLGLLLVTATLSGVIVIGLMARTMSAYSSSQVKGYWAIVTISSALCLFITACISVVNSFLFLVTSDGAISGSQFFVSLHGVLAAFFIGTSVAHLVYFNEYHTAESEERNMALAGGAFGCFSALLHSLLAFLAKWT